MEVVANNYLPGDQRLVDKIVYELKAQGIFDQFRKECFADVDTKPAYQNLRQRVEGSVAGFLKDQSWRPDMNKNQVREMLRKTMTESGYLETGVERIVDQVVNPKINTVFLPKVEEVVYSYLGIKKPNRNEPVKSELCDDLLPNDLEAVSPESEPVDKKDDKSSDTFQDLDESKTEEDESPPFEPLEEQTVYVPQEENSVDSHMSGFSGLISHESNQSNEIKVTPMEHDSQMSRNSSDSRLSIVTSDENSKIEVCEDSQSKSIKSNDSNSKPDDKNKHKSSDKHKSRSEDKTDKDRKSSSKDSKSRHGSSSSKDKDKTRDRKDSKGPSSSNSSSKNDKDKEKDKEKLKEKNDKDRKSSGSSSNKHGSHSSNSSSSSTSKDKNVKKDLSKSDKDKDKSRSSSSHKDSKPRDKSSDSRSKEKEKSSSSDKHKHSSASSSSHSDRHKKEKDSKDKKKENKSKDDHYSSKDKRNDRRSRDRDSNDGQSSKQNFSSIEGHSSQSQKSSQESTSGSGDSNSNHTESTTKAPVFITGAVEGSEVIISPPEQRVKVFKPKCASNMQEALRLRKIRKQLAKLEKKNQLSLASVNVSSPILLSSSINLDDLNQNIVKDEKVGHKNVYNNDKIVSELEVVPSPLQNTVISQDNWDAMEAKLRETVCSEFKEYNDDSLDDSMEDKAVVQEPPKIVEEKRGGTIEPVEENTKSVEHYEEVEESCKYFDSVDMEKIEFLSFVQRFIKAVEKQRASRKVAQKRKIEDNDLKNNNNKHLRVVPEKKAKVVSRKKDKTYNQTVSEKFPLPLSPAESDKSIGRKDDVVTPLKPKRNAISKASNQRYSSDDLYKPRPTFASSRRRGAKNLEN